MPIRHARSGFAAYGSVIKADPTLVGFGMLCFFLSSFGQTWFIGLYKPEIIDRFGLTEAGFGGVYGTGTLVSALLMTQAGKLADHWDLRRLALITPLILACAAAGLWALTGPLADGVMAAGLVSIVLGVVIFGLRFGGQGMMTHMAATATARYFDVGRGRALALGTMGLACGTMLMPRPFTWLKSQMDWQLSWLIIAGLLVLVAIPLLRLLLGSHTQRHGGWTSKLAAAEAASHAARARGETLAAAQKHWKQSQVMMDWRFWVLAPAICAPAFLNTAFMLNQDILSAAKGWTPQMYNNGLAAYALCSVTLGLLGGALADRIGARRVLCFSILPLGMQCLLFWLWDSPWTAVAGWALAGVTIGLHGPAASAFWADIYGTRFIGGVKSLVTALMVLSTALAPVVFGALVQAEVDFLEIAKWSSLYVIIALVGVWAIYARLVPHEE